MPPQSSHLSTIYSDDYLSQRRTKFGPLNLKFFAGLNKRRPNIAKLAKYHVVVGMHWTEK